MTADHGPLVADQKVVEALAISGLVLRCVAHPVVRGARR